MARKNNLYDYDAVRTAKTGAVKRSVFACVSVFIALLVGAAVFVGIASKDESGKPFSESNIAKWCNYWGKGKPSTDVADVPDVPDIEYEDPDVAYGKYGYLVVNAQVEENAPVALSATTRQVNGNVSEVVTATVTPVDADIFGVIWESSDSESVVVTPIEGDNLSCKLTCVSTFTQPVTVTCTVISLETITATCRVDCLVSPGKDISAGLSDSDGNGNVSKLGFGCTYTARALPSGIWDGGTCRGELQVAAVALSLTSAFNEEMATLITDYYSYYVDFDALGAEITLSDTPHACFGGACEDAEEFRAAFAQACYKLGDNCVQVQIDVQYVFREKVYATYNETLTLGFDSATFVKSVDDVTLNPDNPVFGS